MSSRKLTRIHTFGNRFIECYLGLNRNEVHGFCLAPAILPNGDCICDFIDSKTQENQPTTCKIPGRCFSDLLHPGCLCNLTGFGEKGININYDQPCISHRVIDFKWTSHQDLFCRPLTSWHLSLSIVSSLLSHSVNDHETTTVTNMAGICSLCEEHAHHG